MAHSDKSSARANSNRFADLLNSGTEPVSQALTMVFTDLEGSTSLKEEMGDDLASSLIRRHCDLVKRICETEKGEIVNNPGDGFFLTFEKPSQAVRFALRIQFAHSEDTDLPGVRIGIHHGEVNVAGGLGGYLGIEVDTAARIEQIARPGQILVSSSAFKSAKARVRDIENGKPVHWKWYGEYQLRGVEEPIALGEVGIEGMSPFAPPHSHPSVTEIPMGGVDRFMPHRDQNPLIAQRSQMENGRRSNWVSLVGSMILLLGAGLAAGYFAALHQADGDYGPKIESLSEQLKQTSDQKKQSDLKLAKLQQTLEPPELKSYLARVIRERKGAWAGKFEQLYATGTLFMLTPKATHSKLMGVYGRLLRWRLDIDKLDQKDKVLLLLTGYSNEAESLGQNESVGEYINSRIEHLLFDKDLLTCDLDLDTAHVTQKGILVLGEPAAGKSTLLKYLELESARWALGDASALVPVRVELGELEKGNHEELLKRIENIAQAPGSGESGKLVLPASHKYLLLIDALDESPDPRTAAAACIKLSQDKRVGRIIVTSRIINYDVLLQGGEFDLTEHGFRTCLYYGQSLAAVEKRILTSRQSAQRQNLLGLLADSEKRPVWMQFFRMPANFDFASDFLLDDDLTKLESPNRFSVLESYLGNLMRKRDWPGARPAQQELDDMLARVAADVIQTPARSSFADLQVREAMERGQKHAISDEDWKQIENRLNFATKVGIIEKIKGGFKFRHVQFLEYYAARSDLDWEKVDPADVSWREVVLFKSAIGDPAARALVKRIVALAKRPASQSPNRPSHDYVVQLAIQCIDSGPLRDDSEFLQDRNDLAKLTLAQN